MRKSNNTNSKKESKMPGLVEKSATASFSKDARQLLAQLEHKKGELYGALDLGDRRSKYCFLDEKAQVVAEGDIETEWKVLFQCFSKVRKLRIAIEVGTHSGWVSEVLERAGHEVVVANARKVALISQSKRKNDRIDARTLARLLRADPELLFPIKHRGGEAREALVVLKARDSLVEVRTALINSMRGVVKSVGGRLPGCSAESFHHKVEQSIPESVKEALLPVLQQIGQLTAAIRGYDRSINSLASKHKETEPLRQVKGVGPITSLAYALIIENPERFKKSRDVGPYVGLVPKLNESGDSAPQLGISKAGDAMLRRLLVGSAQYILGPFGEDCDLRRHGLKLAARGGKNAKRRAVVAVARKLAVLLHRLWVTGEVYEPLRQSSLAGVTLQ